MRAKILHAEGKTEEALKIYNTKFTDWFGTCGQKTEQLFAKDTSEYYFWVRKNMYELADFAADKLGRTVFFNPLLAMNEKAEKALKYGDLLIQAFDETNEAFFIMLAATFLSRMENDLCYRGGTDEYVTAVMDKHLYVLKCLTDAMKVNEPLRNSYNRYSPERRENPLECDLSFRLNATAGRRAELLNNQSYADVLNKYR